MCIFVSWNCRKFGYSSLDQPLEQSRFSNSSFLFTTARTVRRPLERTQQTSRSLYFCRLEYLSKSSKLLEWLEAPSIRSSSGYFIAFQKLLASCFVGLQILGTTHSPLEQWSNHSSGLNNSSTFLHFVPLVVLPFFGYFWVCFDT